MAGRQGGVVARRQLLDAGVSRAALRHRLAVRRLYVIYPEVYAATPSVSVVGRYLAAVLACGEGAVLSHRAAADHLGLRSTSSVIIEVTMRHGTKRRIPGIRVHQTRALHPDDITLVDAVPCTTWPRTLVDLAGELTPRELERALERTMILRIFDLHDLNAALDRANGRRGIGSLRRLVSALDDQVPLTRRELERRFLKFIQDAGLPRPTVNATVEGHEVDFHWPEHRLIVETDGRETHDTPIAFERDHQRDLELELAGWHVLRLTWRQIVAQPDRVLALLRGRLRGGE